MVPRSTVLPTLAPFAERAAGLWGKSSVDQQTFTSFERVTDGRRWEGCCLSRENPSLEVVSHLPFSLCQGQESASPIAEPTSADQAGIVAAP